MVSQISNYGSRPRLTQAYLALNITFGGTILEAVVNTFMYCILGSKIDNMQTALTWIHDNANVKLPLLSLDALALSNSTSQELATPLAAAAAGTGTSGDEGVIGKIFDAYAKELRDQRVIAFAFCGLYVIIVLVGAIVVLRHTIWPTTSGRHEPEEERFIPPTQSGRHDDQASYFELEDVPLQTADALEKTTSVAQSRTIQSGQLRTIWESLRLPLFIHGRTTARDPSISPADEKGQ